MGAWVDLVVSCGNCKALDGYGFLSQCSEVRPNLRSELSLCDSDFKLGILEPGLGTLQTDKAWTDKAMAVDW